MRKSTRTLIALTAAVSFTAAACGSDDDTPVDDTVVVVDDTVADDIVSDDTMVDDTMVDETDEVVDSVVDGEVVTTEG